MSLPRIAHVAAFTLISHGGAVLLAACAPRAAIDVPTRPTAAPSVVVTAAPTAAPTVAPAATAPPPTGPRTIACGVTRCRAGTEICCLGEPARCIPAPASPPDSRPDEEAAAWQKACGTTRFLTCDDAGDCAAGETCCEEAFHDETTDIYQNACRPLRAGRVTCARAEQCSADDTRCFRKDNVCADANGTMRCGLPIEQRTRPRCGKKPCAAGMTCVDEGDGPACVAGVFRHDVALLNGVIECDRGRDCGDGEACYGNPQARGRRCDFSIGGIDSQSEPAYCTGVADCASFCRHDPRAVPNCHVEPKAQGGHCECLNGCTKDADCEGCPGLMSYVLGEDAVAFCDRRKGACDCRKKQRR